MPRHDPTEGAPEPNREEYPAEAASPEGAERAPRLDDISVENLGSYSEDLRARVAAAAEEKERLLAGQVKESESLFQVERRTAEDLDRARGVLEFMTGLHQAGALPDKDQAKLTEVSHLVVELERQQDAIRAKADAIAGQPEVLGRIQDAAIEEHKKHEAERITAEAMESISRDADELVKAVADLAGSFDAVPWPDKARQEAVAASREIRDRFDEVIYSRSTDFDPKFCDTIRKLVDIGSPAAAYEQELAKLGWLKRREKAALTGLLKLRKQMNAAHAARADSENIRKQIHALQERRNRMAPQYRAIYQKAWQANDRVRELTGVDVWPAVPSSAGSVLEEKMQKVAEGRLTERERTELFVPKTKYTYETRKDPLQHPKNKQLANLWHDIGERAGGGRPGGGVLLRYTHSREWPREAE